MSRSYCHNSNTADQAAEQAASFRMNKMTMNHTNIALIIDSVSALSFFVIKGIIRLVSLVIILAGEAAGENRIRMVAA